MSRIFMFKGFLLESFFLSAFGNLFFKFLLSGQCVKIILIDVPIHIIKGFFEIGFPFISQESR